MFKKIIIFVITTVIVISMLCISVFAEVETFRTKESVTSPSNNVGYALKVKNSNILFPIFIRDEAQYCIYNDIVFNYLVYIEQNYIDVIVPFQTDNLEGVYLYFDDVYNSFLTIGQYTDGQFICTLTTTSSGFEEILVRYYDNVNDIVGNTNFVFSCFQNNNGLNKVRTNFNNHYLDIDTDFVLTFFEENMYPINDLPEGYIINLPNLDIPEIPTEVTDIPSVIVTTLKGFIDGLGSTFTGAFQSLFMNKTVVDGVTTYSGINHLGIYILLFFGIAIGYGVIRWITGLFRRESR